MTPHDIELKRYNDIMHRFDQIEQSLTQAYDDKTFASTELGDKVFLSIIFLKDVRDKFIKYAKQDDI